MSIMVQSSPNLRSCCNFCCPAFSGEILIRVECMRGPWMLQAKCRGHWPLLMVFFLLLSFSVSPSLAFLTEGIVLGFWNFARLLSNKKDWIPTPYIFWGILKSCPRVLTPDGLVKMFESDFADTWITNFFLCRCGDERTCQACSYWERGPPLARA